MHQVVWPQGRVPWPCHGVIVMNQEWLQQAILRKSLTPEIKVAKFDSGTGKGHIEISPSVTVCKDMRLSKFGGCAESRTTAGFSVTHMTKTFAPLLVGCSPSRTIKGQHGIHLAQYSKNYGSIINSRSGERNWHATGWFICSRGGKKTASPQIHYIQTCYKIPGDWGHSW